MKHNLYTLLYIGLLPLLAACSTSDGEGVDSHEGFPQKVNLSATTISVKTTRAETGQAETWAGTERIAVHMKVNNPAENAGFTEATYPYTPSPSGTLTAESEDKMFYFRSPNDPSRICDAWYWPTSNDSYSEQSPAEQTISVPLDQSATPHAANDLLYAPTTTIAYKSRNTIYDLLFCHQLTWLSFQVGADNSSSYAKVQSATIGTEDNPVIYQATFSAPSGATTSTGSREVFGYFSADGAVKGVVTPYQLETPDVDGILCRYETVLIPQTLSSDGTTTHKLFTITLEDGKTYRYYSTMQLKPGIHYTFNLKIVNGTELLVLAKATDWKNEPVPDMEKLHVIAELWTGGPLPGTTADSGSWSDKENSGSLGTGENWNDKETSGSTSDGNNWGTKEPASGSTGSGTNWGNEENTGASTGSSVNWGANESATTGAFLDVNSWKKGTSDSAGVSAGQDWQKEGETQYWSETIPSTNKTNE